MPRLRIRDAGGTLRTIVRVRMRDENNVLRTIQRIRIRDVSNILRTVFQPFAVAISPSPVDGYLAGTATSSVTTSSVTATPTGGVAPYTYAWTQIGSSPYTWTINSPSAAATSFTAAAVEVGAYATNLFQCTVTDANGAIAAANVSATARNNYGQTVVPYPSPGDGCPTLDTLILLANSQRNGAGKAIPVALLKRGMWVWTRHEITGAWGAYQVEAVERVPAQPVCALPDYPEVTPRHRFAVPFGQYLPTFARWFNAGWLARHHRTATIAKISVREAKTYLIRKPQPGAKWRWSHNVKPPV